MRQSAIETTGGVSMKRIARLSLCLVIALTFQCAVGAPGHAVTYYYTGNPFTDAWGTSDQGSYIEATINLVQVLGPKIVPGTIESWTFTYNDPSGGIIIPMTLSSLVANPLWGLSMAVFVNGSGIQDWSFRVSGVPLGYPVGSTNLTFSLTGPFGNIPWGGEAIESVSYTYLPGLPSIGGDPSATYENTGTFVAGTGMGTWTTTPPPWAGGTAVPVPSAMLLLGPGLIGLAAIRRRFKK